MKIEMDFHEVTPLNAIGELDRMFVKLANMDSTIELRLITGHGLTRDLVQGYLTDQDVEWAYEGSNQGCMIVYLPFGEKE
jgi:hypothetical protein